ncbi:hypothetical protein H4S02_002294 [Coemansia sp. RSA 2611]|nr:hypothetical protein H4S02_002294 [Coemansia sp. RSA 2611]
MDYTKCDKASDFEAKFRTILAKLDVVEGEETWQQIDTALKNLTSLVKAGVTKFDTFVPTMKQAAKFINSSVLSERTRLSASGLTLVEELARQMETRFHPLSDLLFPSVMKTCGRANKVFVTRGVNCLTTVITYAHIPEQTPQICNAAMSDPSKTVRSSAAKLLMSIVSCCTVPELTPHLALVEKAIAGGVVDANPDARTTTRQTYEIYVKRFSSRVEQFHAGLSATAKKYLKIEDKSSGSNSNRPQSQFAAFRQRQPLRDRISAQRANAKAASSNGAPGSSGAGDAPATTATGPQRPRPVRPMGRAGPAAIRRDGTSALAASTGAAAVPLTLNSTSTKPSDPAAVVAAATALEPPAMAAKTNSLENVLMSPRSAKPTLARLFGEDDTAPQAAESAEKSPHDSAHVSASPTESDPQSRAQSPPAAKADNAAEPAVEGKSGGTSSTATPAGSGDESASTAKGAAAEKVTAKPVAEAKRAKRAPGLSFSSLNGANGGRAARTPHAVRPQSRNIVSSRMEEALRTRPASRQSAARAKPTRAQRPTNAAPPKRMTLRSDSRGSTGPRGRAAASEGASSGPGYLRATASSAKRVSESANATRGTKRRKDGDQPEGDAPASAKAAKTGPRRRSASKQ